MLDKDAQKDFDPIPDQRDIFTVGELTKWISSVAPKSKSTYFYNIRSLKGKVPNSFLP